MYIEDAAHRGNVAKYPENTIHVNEKYAKKTPFWCLFFLSLMKVIGVGFEVALRNGRHLPF